MSRTVVIVSSAEDLHARAVTRRIKEISSGAAQVVLLDCATFPIGSSLSVRLSASIISSSILHTAPLPNPHSSNARVYLKQAGVSELAGSDIRSIWWRRPRKPLPPDYGGDLLEAFCERNTSDLLWSYASLCSRNILVVNEPFRETVADRKLLQLATAAECGLRIPETLVTNRHEEARKFVSSLELQGRRTIYKQLLSGSIPVGHYTMTVTPEDLARLEEIRSAPLTLQERIEGGIDVRVVVAGDAHFAMAQRVEKNRADSNVSDVRVECRPESWRVELPPDVKSGLDKLKGRLALSFGAYDFITDRDGNWFFLEVNPTGQWLFVEAAIHGPIAEALARLLWFGSVHQEELDGLVYREEDFPGLLEEFVDREAIIQRAVESQQRADVAQIIPVAG